MMTCTCIEAVHTMIKWKIADFDKKYANMTVGDQWPSDLLEMDDQEYGSCPFDLTFWPPGSRPDWNLEGLLRMQIVTPDNELLHPAAQASIENEDGTKRYFFERLLDDQWDWSAKTSQKVVDKFRTEKAVFIVMRIPRPVRCLAYSSGIVCTQKWTIGNFAQPIKTEENSVQWTSDRFRSKNTANSPEFVMRLDAHNCQDNSAPYCAIYVDAVSFGNAPHMDFRMNLYFQREDGQRMFKMTDWHRFTPADKTHGVQNYVETAEVLEFIGNGPLVVCCELEELLQSSDVTNMPTEEEVMIVEPTTSTAIETDIQPLLAARKIVAKDAQKMDIGSVYANYSECREMLKKAMTVENNLVQLLIAAVRKDDKQTVKMALEYAESNGGKHLLLFALATRNLIDDDVELYKKVLDAVRE